MDFTEFKSLILPSGFVLLGIEFEDGPMLDAIGRSALAKAVIEDGTISIHLAVGQSPDELSISIYHEVLEALTVGAANPPSAVGGLNEAGFEQAATEAHRRHGLANPARVLKFLHEFGFTD